MRRIVATWWPLAASWLLMSAELPVLGAVVARLAQPEINLAAYGGIVYPIALIVEAPIIMLLAASTALSKDWASYQKLRRFMLAAGAGLTVIHLIIALTPLYDFVVRVLISAPAEIIEPGRIGLLIMTPWTWSIAYRRFNQGVLIRFGYARSVGIGTGVRLGSEMLVLTVGYLLHTVPGIIVATAAVAAGVISEAIYVGWRVQPVLHTELRLAPPVAQPITFRSFMRFYVPLVMTSLLTFLVQPIGSSAISRLPGALMALAVWPVVSGLLQLFRSPGTAYNEVVVALLEEPALYRSLRRFTNLLMVVSTAALLLLAATPLADLWFRQASALSPALAELAQRGLWVVCLLPALAVLQSWFQGALLHSRRTVGITEAVIVYLVVSLLVLGAGVLLAPRLPVGFSGLYVALAALVLSTVAQTAWLWYRSRPAFAAVRATSERNLTGWTGYQG
jgi:hypothetical protein